MGTYRMDPRANFPPEVNSRLPSYWPEADENGFLMLTCPQSDDTELDQAWKRIKSAFEYGDIVVTLGTGRLSAQEEETLGLAGEHDYAVMDLKVSENGERRMLLKNPWCDGLVWKGLGSSTTIDAEAYPPPSPTLSRPPNFSRHPPPSSSGDVVSTAEGMTGTFWISFADVVQNFESLYLNWNPSLFTNRQDHHFVWDLPSRAMQRSFAHNPQYSFVSPASGAVWILLSRHFQDGELPIARRRAARQARNTSNGEVSNTLGYMSIYLFSNAGGQRVQLPDRPAHQSPFVDSPQTLLRIDAQPHTAYTVVVAQESLPLPRYTFTLSFFSRTPLTVAKASPPLAHYTELAGSWTRRTAGGNARTPTFLHNPQYSLTVPSPTPISLLLATDGDDVPVHADLVWASGRRVTHALTGRDIVVSSGEYRRGCALAQAALVEAGTYTVVISTFEPGQLAGFVLRVGSGIPVELRPVLSDAAGRLRTELETIVFGSDGRPPRRQRARLTVTRLTRASVVARSGFILGDLPPGAASDTGSPGGSGSISGSGTRASTSGTASPISVPVSVRMSIELGTGPDAHAVAVTGGGEFADASVGGLRVAEVDLDPDAAKAKGGLWLIVEQMGTHREGQGIQVDLLSDGRVEVGSWETVDD